MKIGDRYFFHSKTTKEYAVAKLGRKYIYLSQVHGQRYSEHLIKTLVGDNPGTLTGVSEYTGNIYYNKEALTVLQCRTELNASFNQMKSQIPFGIRDNTDMVVLTALVEHLAAGCKQYHEAILILVSSLEHI